MVTSTCPPSATEAGEKERLALKPGGGGGAVTVTVSDPPTGTSSKASLIAVPLKEWRPAVLGAVTV